MTAAHPPPGPRPQFVGKLNVTDGTTLYNGLRVAGGAIIRTKYSTTSQTTAGLIVDDNIAIPNARAFDKDSQFTTNWGGQYDGWTLSGPPVITSG